MNNLGDNSILARLKLNTRIEHFKNSFRSFGHIQKSVSDATRFKVARIIRLEAEKTKNNQLKHFIYHNYRTTLTIWAAANMVVHYQNYISQKSTYGCNGYCLPYNSQKYKIDIPAIKRKEFTSKKRCTLSAFNNKGNKQ